MYPSRFFLCLATVVILQQSGVAPPVSVSDLDDFINVNTNVLDNYIQKKIDQAFICDCPSQSKGTSGEDYINSSCKRMFANQPRKFANTRTNY